jgi:Uncharacterized conserved protein
MINIFTEESEQIDVLDLTNAQYQLIVWNDDVNTFDWVIKALIEVCDHQPEQAEQCTLIIHFKGKCDVKHGDIETLRPMCEGLHNRGIQATIEELVC